MADSYPGLNAFCNVNQGKRVTVWLVNADPKSWTGTLSQSNSDGIYIKTDAREVYVLKQAIAAITLASDPSIGIA